MRNEVLYTTDQAYLEGSVADVELYDGASVQMYGRGEGTVDWQGRHGTIEWTNFPPRRPDGAYLPDITGIIRLDGSSSPLLYRMQGISLRLEHDRRMFSGPVRWYTDDPDLLHLNDRWGYEEGVLDIGQLDFQTRVWLLTPDVAEQSGT